MAPSCQLSSSCFQRSTWSLSRRNDLYPTYRRHRTHCREWGICIYIAQPDPTTVGGCVPSRVLFPNQWGDSLAAFPYPRVEDCLCPGEGPTAAPIRNPFIHTFAANYAESTDMPRSHLLSRKYLPFARRLVNCCVQSWLWTPYAPHSDEDQVQVAVTYAKRPRGPLLWNICLENLGVARQLTLQLLLGFSWSESRVGQ